MPHEVRLEAFQGPIDLLLQLITRQRVDIYEISISTITDEYLEAIGGMETLDLERATGFLVIAATLLELKSVRLLPSPSDGDVLDARLLEERDLLLARLVDCATYREAGSALQVALERGSSYHPRIVALEERYRDLVPDLVLRFAVADIARAAQRVFEPKPEPELDMTHVQPIKASVKEALLEMIRILSGGAPASFRTLCVGAERRIDVVVRFLGLLELYKAGAVELRQLERFGDIEARWTGDADISDVLEDVEEYTVASEER